MSGQVIPLRPAISNHAALCEVLIACLARSVRRGEMTPAESESVLVRASARDCGVLRGTIEHLLANRAHIPISPPRQELPSRPA
jgi:hypothetical protein